MEVTREELNPCTLKLTVVCDPEQVKQGYDIAFRQLTKKIRVPGFRPGKAPRGMLEQVLPLDEWNEAAAEEIVRKSYTKAIEEQQIEVDRTTPPSVTLDVVDKDANKTEYTAKVPLPPKVELGDYKGLLIEQQTGDVTDEDVEFEINELRRRGQTREAVTDRGVGEGDVAVVNVKVEGESGDGRNFMTIAGQTFPQFDEAIMGMRIEEMKNLELSFPETFQEKEWAGKTLQVQVNLNSLSSVRLPELDDTFAQSMRTENLSDLRNRIREALGRVKQQMVRQMVHEQLLKALMERSQVAVSDNMWENLAERRLRETASEQARQKKTLEQYATENGMTVDSLIQAWKERAKTEVERALLIQAVYAKEQMQIDNRELNQELILMAQEYNSEPADLLNQLRESQALDELHFRALSRKVGDYLLSHADVRAPGTLPAPEAAEETPKAAKPKAEKPKAEKPKADKPEKTEEEKPKTKKPAKPKAD